MERQLEEVVDMEDVANTLGMSYAHFRRVFKQQIGFAPYQYHLQLRIHWARELLRATNMSVKDIAARLNFEGPYHFSRMFKKKTAGIAAHTMAGRGKSTRVKEFTVAPSSAHRAPCFFHASKRPLTI